MKINKIHIIQFGKLKDKTVEFDDGLNIIYGKNEFGKSTLAEFIITMLYGQGKSPQNIRQNSRKRYMPWNENIMQGELFLEYDGREIIIERIFGKTKARDRISVKDGITGSEIPELCTDSPGEIICNASRETFENSVYIRQLCTKVSSSDSDEILKKLINLSHSGDEDVSYKNAIKILDSQIKDLNGTRPKGKIPLLEEEISKLYEKRLKSKNDKEKIIEYKNRLKTLNNEMKRCSEYKTDKSVIKKYYDLLESAKKEESNYEDEITKYKKSVVLSVSIAVTGIIISLIFALAKLPYLFMIIPFIILLISSVSGIVMFRRKPKGNFENTEKLKKCLKIKDISDAMDKISETERILDEKEENNVKRMIEISSQTGELKKRISDFDIIPESVYDKQIKALEDKIYEYKEVIFDITYAKECLNNAFMSLQKNFGIKLNNKTSEILTAVSGGKYMEVLTDENFNLSVRDGTHDKLTEGEYLSTGAYDMIYFALRLAVSDMILPDMPFILDDAFSNYDDDRVKYALSYLKSINRQVILFTCHKREEEILKNIFLCYNYIYIAIGGIYNASL